MGCDQNAVTCQHLSQDRARCHNRCRQPAAEMTAPSGVLEAVITHLCGIVRMSRTSKILERRIVFRTDIRIGNQNCQRCSFRNSVFHS